METFAPFLADSLKGFNKYFLSFLVNKGAQGLGHTEAGIKGKKGGKHLTHLYSLYSCRVGGLVFGGCLRDLQLFRFFPPLPSTGPKEPETSLVNCYL